METSVTPLRILAFAALLVGFFVFCRLWPLQVSPDSYVDVRRASRVAVACTLLFGAGAYVSCFVDFWYGLFPPKSLRPLLITGGIVLMALAIAWRYSFQQAVL